MIRWLLIGWIFVISAVAYLDRVNISIAGQFLQRDLHLSDTQLGAVFSAFVFGYALSQAPAGRLADRFGPRLVVAAGTIWWGIFTALTGSVPLGVAGALAILIAIRFFLGVGEAVVYPASNTLVAKWIPSSERGIANGVIFAGVGVGAGIAPPLITAIVLHHGWRWSFWISMIIGIAAGAVWFLIARDRPDEHRWVGAAEANLIRAGLPAEPAAAQLPWRTILASKDVAAVTLSYFTYGYVAYIFFTWFFIYLSRVRGLDLKSSSFYGMLPFLAMATCSPLGGWVSDGLTRAWGRRLGRCGVAFFGLALAAVFLLLGSQAADARLASVVLAGGAGALYFSQSSFWSVSADLGGSSAGSVSGIMNMGCQLAGTITASLTPFLAEHFGWTVPFVVAAALSGIGALAWLAVDPYRTLALKKKA
ncbi:MAG TPA: MFS transporter [Bryobacteraceae bacterium]|nr:MFS transporter [Bryobacteraceae bacterium]